MFAVEIMKSEAVNPKTGVVVSKLRARMSSGEILPLVTGKVVDGKFHADNMEDAEANLKSRFETPKDALRHIVVREREFENEDGTVRDARWATVTNVKLGETLSW